MYCTWNMSILVFSQCRGRKIGVAFFPKNGSKYFFGTTDIQQVTLKIRSEFM